MGVSSRGSRPLCRPEARELAGRGAAADPPTLLPPACRCGRERCRLPEPLGAGAGLGPPGAVLAPERSGPFLKGAYCLPAVRAAPGVCPAAGRAASRALGSFWGRPVRRRVGSPAAPARRGGWGSASPPVLAAWLAGDAGLAGAEGHPGRPALGYPAFQ